MSIDTVWKIFMKDLVKVKFREFLSRLVTDSASISDSKYGKHSLSIKIKITSSEADPRTLLNTQFNDLENEFFASMDEQLKTRPVLK